MKRLFKTVYIHLYTVSRQYHRFARHIKGLQIDIKITINNTMSSCTIIFLPVIDKASSKDGFHFFCMTIVIFAAEHVYINRRCLCM